MHDIEAAVELIEVVKSFGARRAVDSLSLRVPRGMVCGIIGPDGSCAARP